MELSRRDFLKAAGFVTAAAALPGAWPRFAFAKDTKDAWDLTSLAQTIVKGAKVADGTHGSYFRLAAGAGEPHLLRAELGQRDQNVTPKSLLHFAHFTDIHLVDAQSPARVEFLDRFSDPGQGCEQTPFSAAYRPQETLTLHTLEAMVRQIRAIEVSPITGQPISFTVCTGDNTDNEQLNELRWFIELMDGNKLINPDSGDPGYEGVMLPSIADPDYWHPDAGVTDKFKTGYGFPDYPSLLEDSMKSFTATGIGMDWYQVFGNHDGLMQGNAPRNPFFEIVATGHVKTQGPPPGLNPCDSFEMLRNDPQALLTGPARLITADANRHIVSRADYVSEMFKTTGTPLGHGFNSDNTSIGYWFNDDRPRFRFIGLDTVNPGGFESGSIGPIQFDWLEQRLIEASSSYFDADGNVVTTQNPDRFVIIFSHHGLRSMDNPVATPDPAHPEENDLPRILADEVEALVHRFPNVIAWVNGHTHNNVIEPRRDSSGKTQGFWDIGTAAHIDWTCQSRLIEVVDNRDGTLSIFCTMVDHAADVVPNGSGDDPLRMASIARELAANDYQYGFNSKGPGQPLDRNAELVIPAPFDPKDAAIKTTGAAKLPAFLGGHPFPRF